MRSTSGCTPRSASCSENELLYAKVDHLPAALWLGGGRRPVDLRPSGVGVHRVAACGEGAVQRLRATWTRSRASRPAGGGAARTRCWWPHPPGARSLTVSAKGTGKRGRSRVERGAGTGATVDAGARPPGPVPRHAHGPKAHDGTITTAAPDVMWGTDMTSTVTVGEGAACVFVAVDHCTTECIGLHAPSVAV